MNFVKKNIIVITSVVLGRLDLYKQMLLSFVENTIVPYNTRVFYVVINNGSNEGITNWLNDNNKYFDMLINLEQNQGVAKAANLGWGQFYNTDKVKLDPDIKIFSSEWLVALHKVAKDHPDVGLLGASTGLNDKRVIRDFNGYKLIVPQDSRVIDGACFYAPQKIFLKHGYFQENYGLYGYEDQDYNKRVKLGGIINNLYIDEISTSHQGNDDIYNPDEEYGYNKKDVRIAAGNKFTENVKFYEESRELGIFKKSLKLEEPLVIVVMPVYNQIDYLETAINSVINQSYKNFKLIIVNDGSTDDIKRVVNKIKDDRIYYLEQKNEGTGSALNLGFKYAKDNFNNIKYGTWVSSDNIYYEDMLKHMVEFLEENEKYGLVYAPFLESSQDTGQIIVPEQYNEWHKEDLKRGCQIGICFLFNWFLKQVVGDYIEELCEDYDMHIRMATYTDFYFMRDFGPLGVWRNHRRAFSNKKRFVIEEVREERIKLANTIL